MPHVNPKGVDLVVSMFVVFHNMVLLVDHKKLGGWFCPGGHVGDEDPFETPDEALWRELKEETGLQFGDVDVIRSPLASPIAWGLDMALCHNTRQLLEPWKVDMHDFPPLPGHKHLAMVYLLRARKTEVNLETSAHHAIKWFAPAELMSPTFRMLDTIRCYGLEAIQVVNRERRK